MGKEQLLDALAGLQSAGSVEGIRAQFGVVHEALSDIRRKRWRFLEDTCSLVLRHVFGLASSDVDEAVDDEDSRKPSISTLEGLELCLEFIEPLIHATVSIVDALDDEQEAASQRGVLVAALLNLFARVPRASEAESRLVADALLCGVDIHAILATLRFREELIECRRALLPSYESDSEAESELDSDDDEGMLQETGEFESEDVLWIAEHVAKTWGLSKYRYFLQTSGQEYAFAAWSYRGIGNFVHAMLTDEQYGAHALTAVVSPFSWLFHIAAYAHYMIHSEDHQERRRGLELLRVVVGLCPQGKLALNADRRCDTHSNVPESFRGQAASFRERDWMSPLIQVVTNAMVSFPEANDRSSALAVLKELVSKITLADRFYILRDLIVKCPYGNVAAVLVDFVRNDAVHAWSSSTTPQSPFQTTAICILLQDTLTQSAERDLVLHADLIASCLSLLRFLYIRDKDNSTGIRTKSIDGGVWDVLTRINKRLQLKIQESTSGHSNAGTHSIGNDFTHLMILEASLGSTLELCR
ncbi:putative YAP/Alf4/glomulin family protein [Phytophthora infestans]|uniref:Putative YAP/Alf4/glomulin family protein n=1 Tax=Phytophthora infestans TaxID=4787 RepID=A0A8S9URM3_PHYIN|nr:putative YAP/Alf4/glomulin family protein [Phytophthora infestans]